MADAEGPQGAVMSVDWVAALFIGWLVGYACGKSDYESKAGKKRSVT